VEVAKEWANKILWLWNTHFRGDLRLGTHGVSVSTEDQSYAGNGGRGACYASAAIHLVPVKERWWCYVMGRRGGEGGGLTSQRGGVKEIEVAGSGPRARALAWAVVAEMRCGSG
jgi:hypothetical protein